MCFSSRGASTLCHGRDRTHERDDCHRVLFHSATLAAHPPRLSRLGHQPEWVSGADAPLVRGSHIPLITKTDFGGLTLDVPPLETQQLIETIDSLHQRENTLVQLIQQKRSRLIDAVCVKAATRGHTNRKG